MAFLSSLNIPLSGMTAERFRLDIIAQNVTNADTYATNPEDAYKRQMVIFGEDKAFKKILLRRMSEGTFIPNLFNYIQLKGVQAMQVVEDPTPPEPVYSPDNPLADEFGYVYEANVNVAVEEIDAEEATNMYEANRSVFQAMQGIIQSALNIGKG